MRMRRRIESRHDVVNNYRGVESYYLGEQVLLIGSKIARMGVTHIRTRFELDDNGKPIMSATLHTKRWSPFGAYARWYCRRHPLEYSTEFKSADEPEWRKVATVVKVI